MNTRSTDTGLSNPFSTGSGGATFEQLVGASYLASLLASHMPRGLDWGITKEVKFQQRWSGCLLDDIVVVGSDGASDRKLALQVKHDLNFSQSDNTFVRVIQDCWNTFTGSLGWEFNPDADRLGIGLGIYQTKVDRHFRPMLEWARTSKDAAEFLQKVNLSRFSSTEKREYLALITALLAKAKGDDITEHEVWQFLKCFVVIHFDLENAGSRDSTDCWNRLLDQIESRDAAQAKSLFDTLTAIVAKYNRSSGFIDIDGLRSEIPGNISLRDIQDFAPDLKRLRRHSQNVLSSIAETIGLKVHLPRTDIVDQLEASIKTNEVVVISGEPMVGKSVLLKLLANRLQLEGEVITFSSEDFSTSASFEDFLHSISIINDFQDILSAIGTVPLRCILIDGLERAVDDNKKRVINDLILAVRQYNDLIVRKGGHQDYEWRIAFSCRAQEATNLITRLETRHSLSENSLKTIYVESLNDDELEEVVDQLPQLKDLAKKGHLREILCRPLILDILTLPGISLPPTSVPSKLTEAWLLDWFWHDVVRLAEQARYGRGHPDHREQLLISLAKESLDRNKTPHPSATVDPEALSGLVSDRLLLKQNAQIQFAHDVVEDWTLTTLLIQNQRDLPGFLIQAGEPLHLVKAFQLYSVRLLEVEQSPDAWLGLLDTLESADNLSPRWYQTALTAPLYSPLLNEIVLQIRPHLLANDGILLSKLLWALRTFITQPSQLAYSFRALPQAEFEKYLAYMSVPVWKQWLLLIQFVLQNLESINDRSLLEFSFVAEKWMTNTAGNQVFRKEIATFAIKALSTQFLEMSFKSERKSSLNYEEEKQVRKNLVKCVLWAADCLPDEVDDFVRKKALRSRDDGNYGFEELIIEDDLGWLPLCKHLPDTAVDVIGKILCRPLEPDDFGSYYHALFDLGIRSLTDTGPPTPYKGPFQIFLGFHQEQGLELIHRITNHATRAWRLREEVEWDREPIAQVIKLESGEIEIWGDDRVFQWYRFPSVAPDTITCALMALEQWMNEQLENEVDVKELFEQILQKTISAAIVGVCVSVALANDQKCREAIVPIIENPAFWSMDIYRVTQDLTAQASTEAFMTYMSFERDKRHYEKLIDLAKQQHRRFDIRSFVLPLLLFGPSEACERVQDAMRSFPENPPIFFEHEKNNAELIADRAETCRIWAALAERDNYEAFQLEDEGKIGIQFKPPAELEKQQKEREEFFQRQNKFYGFQNWVTSFLRENKLEEAFSLPSAMDYVQELVALDDLSYRPQHLIEDSEGRANVIAMFAAALVINEWEWVEENDYVAWCCEQLLIAASRPEPPSESDDERSMFEMGYRRSAARSLPILLSKQPQDPNVRQAVLKLSFHRSDEVRAHLFNALRMLWRVDASFVRKCIRSTEKRARAKAIYRKYQYLNKRSGVVVAWRRYPKLKKLQAKLKRRQDILSARFFPKPIRNCLYNEIAPDVYQSVLYSLPADAEITSWASEIHLEFLSDLLYFTINNYIHFEQKDKAYNEWSHFDWNDLYFRVLANAVLRLPPNLAQKLLDPIVDRWQAAPSMLEDFLRKLSVTGSQAELEDRQLEIWLPIGNQVLSSEYCKSLRWSLNREIENILGLLIFSDPTGIISWKVDTWKPLWKMTEFIDRWVDTVGHHPDCFPSLVRLLKKIGFELVPEHGINWLSRCLQKAKDRKKFFERSHSASLLAELLHDAWLKQQPFIEQNPTSLANLVHLVDILAEQGESVAIRLQRKLQA